MAGQADSLKYTPLALLAGKARRPRAGGKEGRLQAVNRMKTDFLAAFQITPLRPFVPDMED